MDGYGFELTLSGIAELNRALDEFGEMAVGEITDALEEVGDAIALEAHRNIVDQGLLDTKAGFFSVHKMVGVSKKTHNPWLLVGNSKDTYYMSMYETAKGAFGYGSTTVDIGAFGNYSGMMASLDMNAAMTEYGISKRRARPWLRPAFESLKSYGYIKIEAAMKKACDSANRLNRGGWF